MGSLLRGLICCYYYSMSCLFTFIVIAYLCISHNFDELIILSIHRIDWILTVGIIFKLINFSNWSYCHETQRPKFLSSTAPSGTR
ncbi:hypothetical protein Lalb_Chr22g0358701 [Lupinus albus]|uniref:Uncharacterized protein n=1 Tax=Lupinus albus TaxID=3870 RepID=A0A6A4NH00_LUPAL|nr:hypothetical protein Lalb_Chr22g0358701 [Lupinus albus]